MHIVDDIILRLGDLARREHDDDISEAMAVIIGDTSTPSLEKEIIMTFLSAVTEGSVLDEASTEPYIGLLSDGSVLKIVPNKGSCSFEWLERGTDLARRERIYLCS